MDWARYKALCDRPDVCSRALLERTLAVLEDGEPARALRRVLDSVPLPRPPDHTGPAATDMFVANLDPACVAAINAAVVVAAESGRLAVVLGPASPAGFLAAWREFAALGDRRTVIC
jgi:hypothetical protein